MVIQRTECKKYTITEMPAGAYSVTDLNGTVITSGTALENDTVNVVFTVEGVYKLVIGTDNYIIVELCNLIKCLKSLILKILCKEDDDTCCKGCTDAEILAVRKEILKLISGYGFFLLSVFSEKVNYSGVLSIDACRLERLSIINSLITDLRDIQQRCGINCDDVTTENDCRGC